MSNQFKQEHINSFLHGCINTMNSLNFLECLPGKMELDNTSIYAEHCSVMIGLVGDLNGSVVFSFSTDQMKLIFEKMMPSGTKISDFGPDEESTLLSSVSELCNMISGNTTMIFFKIGMNINITPPTIIEGQSVVIKTKKATTIKIPILSGGTKILDFYISCVD